MRLSYEPRILEISFLVQHELSQMNTDLEDYFLAIRYVHAYLCIRRPKYMMGHLLLLFLKHLSLTFILV